MTAAGVQALTAMKQFAASVKDVTVSDDAKAVADMYLEAKKAMIVFNQNLITTEAASLLADIALVSGHIGSTERRYPAGQGEEQLSGSC